jgi:hypothetical protein
VNEKMVIKPDPSKSIFNSHKNMAFFNQNNNSDSKNKNLIIISNREEINDKKNYNTFEGFYKNKGMNKDDTLLENNNNTSIDNGNIEENMKKVNKDYDNSKDSINRLISLDAIIKTENIKKFDNDLVYSKNSKEISNDNQNNKNIKNKSIIKELLSEVIELSNKQISFLDLMEELQTNTQNQIEDLNVKIVNLDDTIKELNEQLYLLQNEE